MTAALMLLAWGCGGDDGGGGASCGPGTVLVGDLCVPDESGGGGGGGGGPVAMADAGPSDPGGGGGDPGGGGGGGGGGGETTDAGFGTEPPGGGGGFPGSYGCDMAAGECDTWESEIADGLRARQAAAGCGTELAEDERVDRVAERHAEHQATVDRLDATSPDGNLFEQIAAEGVRYTDGAAAFSVTRLGSEDVLTRWDANPDVAPLLTRCGYMIGVGVHTSETRASYVTLLMAKL